MRVNHRAGLAQNHGACCRDPDAAAAFAIGRKHRLDPMQSDQSPCTLTNGGGGDPQRCRNTRLSHAGSGIDQPQHNRLTRRKPVCCKLPLQSGCKRCTGNAQLQRKVVLETGGPCARPFVCRRHIECNPEKGRAGTPLPPRPPGQNFFLTETAHSRGRPGRPETTPAPAPERSNFDRK